MYTGTVLNDDIKLNADYTIVNKEMLEYICIELGYKCNNIIIRYLHKDIQSQQFIIEINLLRVKVTTFSKLYEFSSIQVIQFSRYDKIKDLYNRLIHPSQKKNYKLRLVQRSIKDESKLIKDLENFYLHKDDLDNGSILINPSEESVMSLNLDINSILIVEALFTNTGRFLREEVGKTKEKEKIKDSKGGYSDRDDSKSNFVEVIKLNCFKNSKKEIEDKNLKVKKLESVDSETLIRTRDTTHNKQLEEVRTENNARDEINTFGHPQISNWATSQAQNYDNSYCSIITSVSTKLIGLSNSTHVGEIKGSQLKEIEEEKSEEDKEITVEIFNESSKIDKKSSSENESEKTIVKNKIQIDKIAEKSQKNIEIKYKNDDDIKDQILPIEMLQDDEEAKNINFDDFEEDDDYQMISQKSSSLLSLNQNLNGICGMKNLGKSCYMNSALQVLCHLPDIRDYFLDGQYERDKERYRLNSFVSDELQIVFYNLWKCNKSFFSPKNFKIEAREYIELLDNNKQQDSADFLIQLLELIHNELTGQKVNKTGKYKESAQGNCSIWEDSKVIDIQESVQSSIISQNIHGKYSRTMQCEGCKEQSESEDDFTVVSLRIPSNKEVTVHLKFYPADQIYGNIMHDYEFMFESDQSLISEVQSKLPLTNYKEVYYEYYITSNTIKNLTSISKSSTIKEIIEINNSKLECIVHLYELNYLKVNQDYYDFKLSIGEEDNVKTIDQTSVFKIPINRDDSLLSFHQYVFNHLVFWPDQRDDKDFQKLFNQYAFNNKTRHYRIDYYIKSENDQSTSIKKKKAKSNKNKKLINEVYIDNSKSFSEFLESLKNKNISFKIVRFIPNKDCMSTLEKNKQSFSSIKILSKYDLSLESCLSDFMADEVYPDYNCDACNKVSNCILKTKISKLTKYLIIQFMRFESFYTTTQIIYSNNNQLIKFPTKDLDLSYFYIGDKSKANCIYDLCGVIHITDTLDFGNYYATIKNYINSEDWYLFKDESVEPCSIKDVVDENAYVLIYSRKEDKTEKESKIYF